MYGLYGLSGLITPEERLIKQARKIYAFFIIYYGILATVTILPLFVTT